MIQITDDQAQQMIEFIDSQLGREWDRYTDNAICKDSWEDGKR